MKRWAWLFGLLAMGCEYRVLVPARACVEDSGPGAGGGGGAFDGAISPGPASLDSGAATETGPSDATLARVETCANGIDDDLDGVIDDGCECLEGATQRCFSGPERSAGVGLCMLGTSRCVASAGQTRWSACEGDQQPVAEIANGLDDDCDGQVDEGVECPGPDASISSCYHGSQQTLGVGACRAGAPYCVGQTEPDGPTRYVRHPGLCPGEVLPSAEVCDGIDNDCNGQVDDIVERCDRVDNDCDGEVDEGCVRLPANEMMLFRRLGSGGSAMWRGSEVPMLLTEVVARTCAAGEVIVELADGTRRCVPEPTMACPQGQQLDYVAPDGWRCVPCHYVVQFGVLFAFERVCANEGRLKCWEGTVPTFVEDTRRWECRPTCNNGLYDQIVLDGRLLCVPC